MRKVTGAVVLSLMVIAALFVTMSVLLSPLKAHGSEGDIEVIAGAIRTLRATVSDDRAEGLAEVIDEAADENDLDPLLLVALVMRESSFSPTVERLERLGAAGELGLLQVHPRNTGALSLRPEGCEASLETARCQVITGARYLAHVRRQCQGSPWIWVAAYGRSSCPTDERDGRADTSTRVAHNYYLAVGGQAWR